MANSSTQQRLVATTAALMRERGYHGAGLGEILATSGVPRGSLYHHFPAGKAALAAESLRQSGARLTGRLEELAEQAASLADGLHALFDAYIAELEGSDYRRGCPIATVALESAVLDPQVRRESEAAMHGLLAWLAGRIRAENPRVADPEGLALDLFAAFEGGLLLAKALRSTAPLATVRDRAVARLRDELEVS